MKTFVTLPEKFSRKGKTWKKTALTEKEALGICKLSGKTYRRACAKAEPEKVVFYLEDKEVNYVELVMWEDVRRDCKYPIEDNNDGFEYGINLTDFEGEGDILDVMWFQSEEERSKVIEENKFVIIFD